MVSESEIRNRLADLIHGDLDLNAFANWFAEETWNIHLGGDNRAQELAYSIELLLAEHSSGHLTENDLRDEIRPIIGGYARSESVVVTESSLSFSSVLFPREWPSADIQHVMAFSLQSLP